MPEAVTRSRKLTPRILAGGAAAAVVLVFGLAAAPWPPKLSTGITGDTALADRVRPLLTAPADQVSVAYVNGDNVRYAGFGADEHTEYEIGSVSKTFTASLLADAVARGEVTLETTVADILGERPAGSRRRDRHRDAGRTGQPPFRPAAAGNRCRRLGGFAGRPGPEP